MRCKKNSRKRRISGEAENENSWQRRMAAWKASQAAKQRLASSASAGIGVSRRKMKSVCEKCGGAIIGWHRYRQPRGGLRRGMRENIAPGGGGSNRALAAQRSAANQQSGSIRRSASAWRNQRCGIMAETAASNRGGGAGSTRNRRGAWLARRSRAPRVRIARISSWLRRGMPLA